MRVSSLASNVWHASVRPGSPSGELTLSNLERLSALASAALLVSVGLSRRSVSGWCLVAAAAPLGYRAVTGRWPGTPGEGSGTRHTGAALSHTRAALSGGGGTRVQESIRLELPIEEVYRFWRNLENLPRFMTHVERVTPIDALRSRWMVGGPAGTHVEWEAEIINDVQNRLIAWRSLPGSDVVTAGSVNFRAVREGQSTQVTVNLQYSPPGRRVGVLLAWALGRSPSWTIREDLRRLKQLLETGEVPVATAPRRRGVR